MGPGYPKLKEVVWAQTVSNKGPGISCRPTDIASSLPSGVTVDYCWARPRRRTAAGYLYVHLEELRADQASAWSNISPRQDSDSIVSLPRGMQERLVALSMHNNEQPRQEELTQAKLHVQAATR